MAKFNNLSYEIYFIYTFNLLLYTVFIQWKSSSNNVLLRWSVQLAIYVSCQEVPTKTQDKQTNPPKIQSFSDDLSEMRRDQVKNKHVCSLGQKFELESMILYNVCIVM